MSNIRQSDHGIVVEHLENGIHYAISDKNYNQKIHRKVRELGPGETVQGYQPKHKDALSDPLASQSAQGSPAPTQGAAGDQAVVSGDAQRETEGSAPADTKGK